MGRGEKRGNYWSDMLKHQNARSRKPRMKVYINTTILVNIESIR